jgi:high-affinity Fe2+/Pb2+ permease
MAAVRFPDVPALGAEANIPPADHPMYKDANENRSLTAGLGGTTIAILTFVLIFLYDRALTGQINNLLFQGTLLIIVVSLSLISLSSLNYWFVMEALRTSPSRAAHYQLRADQLFASSVVLLLLEPTLILFTVQLYYVGVVALALWGVGILVISLGWRELR